MAPRGIVAAAVSSVFAGELIRHGFSEGQVLVPVTFLVIIGTSAVYGSTAFWSPQSWALPNPNHRGSDRRRAFVGARDRGALQRRSCRLPLVDSNWENVSAAHMGNLPAYYGAMLSEYIQDEVELYGIGTCWR